MSVTRSGSSGPVRPQSTPVESTPSGSTAAAPPPPPPADSGQPTPDAAPAAAAPSAQTRHDSRAGANAAAHTSAATWGSRLAAMAAGGVVGGVAGAAVALGARVALDRVAQDHDVLPSVADTPATPGAPAIAQPAVGGPVPVSNTTPPPLPAGTYDVSQVTPQQLTQMRADPTQRALANTIGNAQTAYADRIAAGARVLVNTSAGNGGQPVLTMVPPGFDYSQPARVHTHYHGFHATVADPVGHGSGTTVRMAEIQARDHQAVFVLPECRNAPANAQLGAPGYATDWHNVSSQTQTTQDALAGAGITHVGTTIVSAHSGGGSALANAMNAHRDGSGVQCDRLEMQDCLYGSEHAIARWAGTANGQACRSALYLHGSNTHSPSGIRRAFGNRYQQVDMSAQGRINDQNNPVLTDANGQPITGPDRRPRHRFKADSHNRTVGQFMDAIPGP